MEWRLNRLQYPVCNLGPGRRLALWTQGCSLRCAGCLSPDLWSNSGGRMLEVEKLLSRIIPVAALFDGITITGGEPFSQYHPLMEFCRRIKEETRLSLYVFSGYTLAELDNAFPKQEFRSWIDFLVDGRYDKDAPSRERWRGSANQRLYRLNPEGERLLAPGADAGPWSVCLSREGNVFLSGIPAAGELDALEWNLEKKGVQLEFR